MNNKYYISAFIAGFSLMTVELTSSRIVAPIIGSSIFTWTSVIGTILLGLAIGNLIGGKITDKYSKIYGELVLAISALISSVFVYLIIPLSKNTDIFIGKSFSIITVSIVVCIFLFLLPSIAIGSISPIIFDLYVNDIKNIGKKYGILSGLWSLGSILGVFITGFYFISKIGSSGTIYLISVIFLILFFFFFFKNLKKEISLFKNKIILGIMIFILFLLSLYFFTNKKLPISAKIIHSEETGYYDLKVVDYNLYPFLGKNRILFLDLDSHSISTEKTSKLFYTDIYPAFSAFSDKINKIHIIGAGAYTLPINLRKYYPESEISVSEIDPRIEKIGNDYFNLAKYNISTEIVDARIKFSNNKQGMEKYDLIYGDAYNSFISVPWHLLTKEFVISLKNNLNDDGIYAINFIGTVEGNNSEIFESIYQTVNEVFPNNYIFSFGFDPHEVQSITIFGINNDKYIDQKTLLKKLSLIDTDKFLSRILLDKNKINNRMGMKKGIILTDDFSPIEYMMTGLMKEYFKFYLPIYKKMVS
jgi:predicted membrane-bound spermidine synthase